VLVKFPAEQEVTVPVRMYPGLQVTWQLVPEGRFGEQVPSVPFVGADTEQELALHDCCCVSVPREQDVLDPLML
jgi:hypothetical protein